MKGTWLPSSADNFAFLHQTEPLITTPLERELWERLARETGHPDAKDGESDGNWEGIPRKDLVDMLQELEFKLGEDRVAELIN